MMKLGTRLALLLSVASMAGCASGPRTTMTLDGESLAPFLDARVIDCTLPFLATHALTQATLRYRYHNGSTTFETENQALAAHLAQCAATSSGPDITFEREIEVWASNGE